MKHPRSTLFGQTVNTLTVLVILLSLTTLASCRSYYSSRSRYYYYSYYSYYYSSSCSPPSPPAYCFSTVDPHLNVNITARCAAYVSLASTVDTNTPLNDYSNTITGWTVDYEKLYFYDNSSFIADFFISCHSKIVAALCQSYVQSCAEGATLTSCVKMCTDMKQCRENVFYSVVPSEIQNNTDFWIEDCKAYSTCDAAGAEFCCWGGDASRAVLVWWLGFAVMMLYTFVH